MNDKGYPVDSARTQEMNELLQNHDWSDFPLGCPTTWPLTFQTLFRLMLSSRFPMFVAWGPKLNLLYNAAYGEVLASKHPAAFGRPMHEVWGELGETLQPWIQRTLAGETLYYENLPLVVRRRGKEYEERAWFTFSYSPAVDDKGVIAGLFCVCMETTPTVRAQQRQTFYLQLADVLRDLSKPHDTLANVSALLGRELGVSRVLFGEHDSLARTVSYHSNYTDGTVDPLTGSYPAADFGDSNFSYLERGETWICDDLARDPRVNGPRTWPAFDALRIYSSVVTPMSRRGMLVASLFVNDKKPRHWTADEIALIKDVAERTWSAVQHASAEKALHELNRTLEQHVADALTERDQVWNVSADLIVIVDAEGRYRNVNPAWTGMLGYTADELRGSSFDALVHPEELAAVREAFQQMLQGGKVADMDLRIRARDGSYRWISWTVIAANGVFYASGRDVSLRRLMEVQALHAQKAGADARLAAALTAQVTLERDHLRQLFNMAPGFMVVMRGPEHELELANDAYYQLVGHRHLVGKRLREALPELQGQGLLAILDRVWKTGQPFVGRELEVALQRKPDAPPSTVYVDFVYQPLTEADGTVSGIFVQGYEVTEQVMAREKARVASERWQLAIESTGDGVWDWHVPTNQMLYSLRLKEMLGYADEDFANTYGAWESRLYPDDHAHVLKSLHACMSGMAASFHVECRMRRRDGNYQWVEFHGMVVERDAEGWATRITGMMSDISAKKQTEEQQWHQANFDVLTGLPNRRLFRDRLDQEVQKTQRSGTMLALLFIDLDRFKEANDLLGHDVGDLLLTEAAQRITASVRKSDTVARLGGDEFTVILAGLAEKAHIENTAQKIIQMLAEPFKIGSETVYLSASVGITVHSADASTSGELIRNADQAMYAAKSAGRNRFSYFTPAMQQAADLRSRLSSDLRNAINADQLEVYYQPVIDLTTGRIIKAEALLRWRHPKWGMIEPNFFIPIAEETGEIKKIGDWVFKMAAACAKRWGEQRGQPFQVAVNKSPAQFMLRSGDDSWLNHLQGIGLTGSSIAIEITEGLLLNTTPIVAEKLAMYRKAGVQLALDDFGTGYSSLAYLKKFDIDYLKIDQSFISGMSADAEDRAIAESIIVMARRLGLEVIAEGIETEEQKLWLLGAGCNYGQGLLFSGAVPADVFERMLAEDPVLA